MTAIVTKNISFTPSSATGSSTVNEPSVASAGSDSIYSGNWYTGYSTNAGASWTALDPYSFFPPANNGFCCDQSLIYAPQIDNFFWLLQYSHDADSNTLRVANCARSNLDIEDWAFLDLVPGQINSNWDGEWFDYNHIALSDNYLYIGTNMFRIGGNGGWTRCVIFRIPLQSFVGDGASGSLEYFESTQFGSLRCTMGATDTMYFAAHRFTDEIAVFSWPESAPTASRTDIQFTPWNWGNAFSANTNGGVNWMGRADGRITAGFTTANEVGFGWMAPPQDGRPNPFIKCVVIDKSTMTFKAERDIWTQDHSFGWPEMCPDNSGNVGVSLFFSTNTVYPSHAVGKFDVSIPNWTLSLSTAGTHAPASGRWGDYIHMRPLTGATGWVTSAYTMQGGDQTVNVDPRYVEFI